MLKNLRGIIVSAFQRGERQVDIVRRFKNDGLSKQFVSYTIKRFRSAGMGQTFDATDSCRGRFLASQIAGLCGR